MSYPTDHLPPLHDLDLCREIYKLAEEEPGLSHYKMAERLGSVRLRPKVQRYLAQPERYSPYVDDTAVDRAFLEPEVYNALSVLERHVFWDRWMPILQAEYDQNEARRDESNPVRIQLVATVGFSVSSLQKLAQNWRSKRVGGSS